jgi:hypothetical protein
MESLNWDNIDQYFLQEIYNIYESLNIEDEKEKIKEILITLYGTSNHSSEFIKEHIKVFYFLEHNEHIDIINEVLESIIVFRIISNNGNDNTNILLNLLNNIINNVNDEDVIVSLTEEELNKIPSKQYSEISNECINCPICQDNIEQENIVRELKCKHFFHINCIDKYLLDYSYKCPICRNDCGIGSIKN